MCLCIIYCSSCVFNHLLSVSFALSLYTYMNAFTRKKLLQLSNAPGVVNHYSEGVILLSQNRRTKFVVSNEVNLFETEHVFG